LNDQRAHLAGGRPCSALGQTDAVIGDDDLASCRIDQAAQGDRAAVPAGEGVFQRIGQQFVDDEPGRHGNLGRYGKGVEVQVQADALVLMRPHDGRCDAVQIRAHVDAVARGRIGERTVEQRHGFDPPREPVEPVADHALRQAAGFEPDQAGDHLQVVFHAVLQFP